jgi:hypothetical protein
LVEENSRLKEKVGEPIKDPSNSSLAPSSSIKPNKKKPRKQDENGQPIKGKPGAKKGHKAHH